MPGMDNRGLTKEPLDARASPVRPVALSLGPLQIHWYGLTYLAAFGLFLFLAARRVQLPHSPPRAGPGATWRTCCSWACWV